MAGGYRTKTKPIPVIFSRHADRQGIGQQNGWKLVRALFIGYVAPDLRVTSRRSIASASTSFRPQVPEARATAQRSILVPSPASGTAASLLDLGRLARHSSLSTRLDRNWRRRCDEAGRGEVTQSCRTCLDVRIV